MGCLKVVVQRQYPILFMEKKGEDVFLVRTATQEEQAQRIFEVCIYPIASLRFHSQCNPGPFSSAMLASLGKAQQTVGSEDNRATKTAR